MLCHVSLLLRQLLLACLHQVVCSQDSNCALLQMNALEAPKVGRNGTVTATGT